MPERIHKMPFGPELMPNGDYIFRLWAPQAQKVDLIIENAPERVPMTANTEGWYLASVPHLLPGMRYRFQINQDLCVPDPASRFQPEDVHGPSELVDSRAFRWSDDGWKGRPWEETILYELHVGTFTPEGTYQSAITKLDHLVNLGVTAVELMPLSDFPGRRNWGYDGVLPFAPDSSYGRPEDLKALIQAAHQKGLMVFLDVVYNHFGPEGNYLHVYAKSFFTDRHKTPWGAAINFDDEGSRVVRDFFIHNALYWLNEYRIDGLRFDAVHAIRDESETHILQELAETIYAQVPSDRLVHLVLENDMNTARWLTRCPDGQPRWYEAQWNDDIHHALHVLVSGETGGYYSDYSEMPAKVLGRCLTEGFAYQGDPSPYRDGEIRGEASAHLPHTSFVSIIQNHDQVGNRAFGERLTRLGPSDAVRAATTVYLLAPSIPMPFMGEEWAAPEPFPFFCDFGPDLAQAVTEGRRSEFAKFPQFSDPALRSQIPDPNAPETYEQAKLDWRRLTDIEHQDWLRFYQHLLSVRHTRIIPVLKRFSGQRAETRTEVLASQVLRVTYTWPDNQQWSLLANFSEQPVECSAPFSGDMLAQSRPDLFSTLSQGTLPGHSAIWLVSSPGSVKD